MLLNGESLNTIIKHLEMMVIVPNTHEIKTVLFLYGYQIKGVSKYDNCMKLFYFKFWYSDTTQTTYWLMIAPIWKGPGKSWWYDSISQPGDFVIQGQIVS